MPTVSSVVSLAKELVKSCVVRCKEHIPSTSMGRDLEYLFATSYDGGTQEPGSSTNSMGCAGKVTSASAKPIACAEISSPLLKGKLDVYLAYNHALQCRLFSQLLLFHSLDVH